MCFPGVCFIFSVVNHWGLKYKICDIKGVAFKNQIRYTNHN